MNTYVSNDRPSKHMKQILTELKREIYSSSITAGEFNTSSTIVDKTTR